MVWDRWLVDTLSSWQRQVESNYAIPTPDLEMPSQSAVAASGPAAGSEDRALLMDAEGKAQQVMDVPHAPLSPPSCSDGQTPFPLPRKRARGLVASGAAASGRDSGGSRLSVADYLRAKSTGSRAQG